MTTVDNPTYDDTGPGDTGPSAILARFDDYRNRPRPLLQAANGVVKTLGLITAVLTAAAGYGLISVAQQDAVQGLLGLIPGAIVGVLNVLTAFRIVRVAEPKVTPISSPQNNAGQQLVPAKEEV
jgi:hypothetical protein